VSRVVLRNQTFSQMAARFAAHPDDVGTVRCDSITAGLLVRRQVRAAFSAARIHGAEVEVHEERGLLDSVFTVRLHGTGTQILPALRQLAALEQEGS
jgi:hypothetical protein